MAARVLFHIDINAFFASAEILRNSALEDQPVVVSGLSRRGVVCTASYKAREFGIHSAMPLMEAIQICPQLVVLPCDFDWYEKVSKRFFDYIKSYSPYIEIASIDECYVDMTEVITRYQRPLDLAWQIQQGVLNEIGLHCSIGVASNRFLAKMASDMRKPMGITVLRRQELEKKLWPLSISEMQGIGKKTAPILIRNGIETIGDLANPENESKAMALLGKSGYQKIMNARGYDSASLCFNSTVQSISQSTTLDKDIEEYDEIKATFKTLAKGLANRAKEEKVKGKQLSISIRYTDFSTIVRSTNLQTYTQDESVILENAYLLFDKNHITDQPIRHLGIGLGSLASHDRVIEQISLFEVPKLDRDAILNELNDQLTDGKLIFASSLLKKQNN